MARPHPCDVCGHPRKRWQRLCETCFGCLPRDIRNAIIMNHRAGQRAQWRAARRRAIEYLAQAVQRHMANYARTAALLGERDA